MSITIDAIIAGINEPVIVQLANRAFDSMEDPEPFDASGKTIALELRGNDGTEVDTDGKVEWEDASVSKAKFNREEDDLLAELSPYRARWLVTSGGITYAYPSTAAPDLWEVVNPA